MRDILGLDALVMMKDPSFLIFAIGSVLACIPLTVYFSFTNTYLNDVHVQDAAAKMTLGQASEVGMMLLMPFIFRRVSVKWVLLMGLMAWSVRYVLLAFGECGFGGVDVLSGGPAARRLLRLFLHDWPALHRPAGTNAAPAQFGAGVGDVPDVWRGYVLRVRC
jgi:hypothetical protein